VIKPERVEIVLSLGKISSERGRGIIQGRMKSCNFMVLNQGTKGSKIRYTNALLRNIHRFDGGKADIQWKGLMVESSIQ